MLAARQGRAILRAVSTGRAGRGRRGGAQRVVPDASRRRQTGARGPRNVAAGGDGSTACDDASKSRSLAAGDACRLEPARGADQAGGRFRVLLDDVACVVDARRTDLGWSIVYEGDRRSLGCRRSPSRPAVTCSCSSRTSDCRVAVDGRRFRGDPLDASRSANEAGVVAPMPGASSASSSSLATTSPRARASSIVEAMKMENELAAPRAGPRQRSARHRGPVGRSRPRCSCGWMRKRVGWLFTLNVKSHPTCFLK